MLYGSHSSAATPARDEVQWVYDGKEEMTGLFSVKFARGFFFPFMCMQKLKFSGPIDETRLDWLNHFDLSH